MTFPRIAILLLSWFTFLGMICGATTEKQTLGKFKGKNLKVLRSFDTKEQLESTMKQVTKALGVECSFCHNPQQFPSDVKQKKHHARIMMEMVDVVNLNYVSSVSLDGKATCFTCHRGNRKPEK